MENRPIRVLQVFTILNMGGAETNLMNYFRHLDTRKLQFDFLVHREEEGHFEKEIIARGSKIYRLPPVHPFSLGTYKKAVDDFFREHAGSYDIVHGQLSELGVFIYEAAKKYGVPVRIAHAHNSAMPLDVKAPFRYLWKKRMMKSINGYFSCGRESSEWLYGKEIGAKAFILNNSIVADKYKFDEEVRAKYRKDLNVENNKVYIHIGRFDKQKNHHFLIDIFYQIRKEDKASKLFLVGEGPLMSEISHKAQKLNLQNDVAFLKLRTDIPQLLCASDCFLMPSFFEGFGIAFLEAQASGLKCVIADGVSKHSRVTHNNILVLSLKQHAEEWAAQILNLDLGRDINAYKKIVDAGFDSAQNAAVLVNEYRKLLETCQP